MLLSAASLAAFFFDSSHLPLASATGQVTEYPLPTPNASPAIITLGPDGNLWFTEAHAGKLGKVNPAGSVTEIPLPDHTAGPAAITSGPDGNLWFTEFVGNSVGRLRP